MVAYPGRDSDRRASGWGPPSQACSGPARGARANQGGTTSGLTQSELACRDQDLDFKLKVVRRRLGVSDRRD
eukprot:1263832-Rhodomonas_salina.1